MSDLKIFAKTVDEKARDQIDMLLNQKAFANCKVRIMPDVHAGAGCVIGFTANLGNKVIPNIVGVDIGCGMYCCPIGNVDIDYAKLDAFIRKRIPSGMNVHEKPREFFDITTLYCYERLKNKEWLENSLGRLGEEWPQMLHDGFKECMRVLKPNGTLIFKWSEFDIPADKVWKAIGQKPLFGHHSGKQSKTFWGAFMKFDEEMI